MQWYAHILQHSYLSECLSISSFSITHNYYKQIYSYTTKLISEYKYQDQAIVR